MPVEKVTQVAQTKPWCEKLGFQGVLLYGQYTYGIAGERFFREIKDNAKITGTKCQNCNLIYVPPRIYCERCFDELKEWCEIENKGEIYTYTVGWVDLDGSRLEQPAVVALVKFDGVYGGLVHKVAEISPEKVKIGMKVAAVYEEEREGSILDIKYFKPV